MRFLSLLLCLFHLWPAAKAAGPAPETRRIYLSGTDSKQTVDWDFLCTAGARAGVWSRLPVPSNWEMFGFGTLSYSTTSPSESGYYRHRFDAPADLRGQQVHLVFEGAMTDTTARLNGQTVGEKHQGGFYRFSYEVTSLLRSGESNLLEVEVDETSSNDGVNRAERTGDYWNFGGIFRPVYLEVVPPAHIERVAVDARADGHLAIHAFVASRGKGAQLRAWIRDLSGREVLRLEQALASGGTETVLRGQAHGAATWSAETPHLHELELLLVDDKGAALHRTRTRFGFRTFEVRAGEGLFLNGRQIVLKGSNRHSFNARTGRALSEEDHRTDIALMREMNMNAVRMSHYPPDTRFLELCDELGLYVLDEIAGWQKSYDTAVGRKIVRETVIRDVNHPSILFWDNGNEGGWNTELDAEFAKWDPQQRPVLHPWEVFGGINTAHYKVYPQAKHLAQGMTTSWSYDPAEVPKRGDKPLIYLPTEFLHALYDGGAGAGLEDYWNLMRASPTLGGGFIWAFRDEGVVRPGSDAADVMNNKAPDGIVGPHGEREGSFYAIKEIWSPLRASGQLPREGDRLQLRIDNTYSFTDASRCRYRWTVRDVSRSAEGRMTETVSGTGEGGLPAIAPGSTGGLEVVLPQGWREAEIFNVSLIGPGGEELWTESWPLPGALALRTPARKGDAVGEVPEATVELREEEDDLTVRVGRVHLGFNRKTGRLERFQSGEGTLSLTNGPRAAAGDAPLQALTARREGNDVVVAATYSGALRRVIWRIAPDGWVDCAWELVPVAGADAQGVCFDYPEAHVRGKTWLGEGPYRAWRNRRTGGRFGLWSNAYNDTITGWSGWVYPEFKGCFAEVRWLGLETAEGRLEVVPGTDDLYVQVLRPSFPPGELQASTRVDLPEAGLALLHVIPAIGTKFSRPEMGGPQGEPVPLPEVYRGAVRLRYAAP